MASRIGKLAGIINYRKISEGNTEFRRSDYWLLEIEAAKGVYFPGNELIQIRTQSFSSGISDSPSVLDKKIRGVTILQGGRVESTSGTLSITIQDRVDQTISYWIESMKLAIAQRNRYSGLAKDLYVVPLIRATYYDINENKVRTLEFYKCILSGGNLPEDGTEDAGLEEAISVEFQYETFERVFENVNLSKK